jgi:hypothetical protein
MKKIFRYALLSIAGMLVVLRGIAAVDSPVSGRVAHPLKRPVFLSVRTKR